MILKFPEHAKTSDFYGGESFVGKTVKPFLSQSDSVILQGGHRYNLGIRRDGKRVCHCHSVFIMALRVFENKFIYIFVASKNRTPRED